MKLSQFSKRTFWLNWNDSYVTDKVTEDREQGHVIWE